MKKEVNLLEISKNYYEYKRCKSCKNINDKDNKKCCHCGKKEFNKNGSYVIGAINSFARNGTSYNYDQSYLIK